MKHLFFIFVLLISSQAFSQTERKVSVFLSAQGNKTLYDRTKSNNNSGAGIGLQAVLNSKSFVKPTVTVNGDLFGGTKERRLTADGRPIAGKQDMLSIHAGPLMPLTRRFFVAATAGTHFYNGSTHFSIRPSTGVYPAKSKKWMLAASFTHVYQRDHISNEPFGYLSIAAAMKLL